MAGNFALLVGSLALRIGAVMVLFVFFARTWGAEVFGQFMYLMSVGAMLVLLCEFGFAIQILRDVGRSPATAAQQIGRLLGAKLWLALSTAALTTGVIVITAPRWEAALLLALLTASSVLLSFSDFFFAVFRALGHYRRETAVTAQGNAAYLLLGLAALHWHGSPVFVATSLLLARLAQLALSVRAFAGIVPERLAVDLRPRAAWQIIRKSAPFGAEMAVGAVYANADTLLVTHALGYGATGVYQAAARFYQGACQLPPLFSGLFLPRLAHIRSASEDLTRQSRRLFAAMMLAGALCFGAFLVLGQLLPTFYSDPALGASGALLPWFGLLLLIRFAAAAQGIAVTALDGQMIRVWASGASLLVMWALATPLMEQHGVLGMVFAVIIANWLLALAFTFWLARYGVRLGKLSALALGAGLLGGVLMWIWGV